VTNLSGDLEAEGDVSIAATQFTNQRRVVMLATTALTPSVQSSNKQTTTNTFDWTTDLNALNRCATYGQTSRRGHALRCGPMG